MSSQSSKAPRKKLRWFMVVLAAIGIIINYVDRSALAVALPYLSNDLNLSPTQAGIILGLFFWTYAAFQIPMGWAVDRFGSRIIFALSCAWWSVCTAATAITKGFWSLSAARLLLGVGEAGAFPSCVKVVSQWFPKQERAFASGVYTSGARVGTVIALPIVTAIIAAMGWKIAFVVIGLAGLIWVVAWLKFYRTPSTHPAISEEELAYIKEGGARTEDNFAKGDSKKNKPTIRWTELLNNRAVMGMTIAYSCTSFVLYFFITWFPAYLVNELGFSILELGLYGAIPGVAALVAQLLGGYISDTLVRKGMDISKARKTCIVIGSVLSISIAFAAFTGNPFVALALLSISFAGMTFADSSVWAVPADIAPEGTDYAASIGGIFNSFSNFAGIASPVVIGALVGATGSFAAGFITAGAFAVISLIFYVFVTGKLEPIEPKDQRKAIITKLPKEII